jgi:hypothetical protein
MPLKGEGKAPCDGDGDDDYGEYHRLIWKSVDKDKDLYFVIGRQVVKGAGFKM